MLPSKSLSPRSNKPVVSHFWISNIRNKYLFMYWAPDVILKKKQTKIILGFLKIIQNRLMTNFNPLGRHFDSLRHNMQPIIK